jgi:hypothetical protein
MPLAPISAARASSSCRTAAYDVGDAGKQVFENVRANNGFAGYNAEVLLDFAVLKAGSSGNEHVGNWLMAEMF